MSSNIDHMLTNIVLWVSAKPRGTFVLQSPKPQESRVIEVTSFAYDSAREKIVNYLQSLGTIDYIKYNHENDWYYIYLIKEDEDIPCSDILREYVLYYGSDNAIKI